MRSHQVNNQYNSWSVDGIICRSRQVDNDDLAEISGTPKNNLLVNTLTERRLFG
jgi:hypothetical protein